MEKGEDLTRVVSLLLLLLELDPEDGAPFVTLRFRGRAGKGHTPRPR